MHRREVLALLASSSLPSAISARPASRSTGRGSPWESILDERLPLYGHRNWIVVADSAYPAQSRAGIETVVSQGNHIDVLRVTLSHLLASKHVRPIVYQDQEFEFVPEQDAPGIGEYKGQLAAVLNQTKVTVLPHLEIIRKLDETAQTFDVLIIKTTLTLPYTSVFFQLDCAYWPASSEERLRKTMAGHHE
jgi:hypothetical protein